MRWIWLTIASLVLLCIVWASTNLPQKLFSQKLLPSSVSAQTNPAKIYFVDIGQGAGTLIVSPTGKTLLVDGGPPGGGTNKIIPLLNKLGISTIDFTVLTHYHIDHDVGLTEVLNANRVAGISYDVGDGANVVPPTANSTRTAYLNYVTATSRSGVTRNTIQPGQVIDLGGGMRATCIVEAGNYLSGANIPINTLDLNNQSISLLIEYNNFDYLISGDLTGGGNTTTARGIDLETYVGQLVGDIDVIQLNHHGSNTSNNQRLLAATKAEIALAQTGSTNTFGHPTQDVVNRYLNTPTTNGNFFAGENVPTPGVGPVFYENEQSPADPRCSQQGIFAASSAKAGMGTVLLQTDGTTNFSVMSFDDGGIQISPTSNTYTLDNTGANVTTNFPPTVIPSLNPTYPLATEAETISAQVNDRESAISSVVLNYALNGTAQTPLTMNLASGSSYQATIPAQPNGTRVDYTVVATAGGQTTSYKSGYFSGITPISALRTLNGLGEPLYAEYNARIQGTVTAGTNTFSVSAGNDDYIKDATGGINIFRTTQPTGAISTSVGQTIEARGFLTTSRGILQLNISPMVTGDTTPIGLTTLSSGTPPTPTAATIAQLNANPENFEAQLISIANCTVVSGMIPGGAPASDVFLILSDGSGTFSLKVDRDTDVPGLLTPTGTFTAIGIIQQDDTFRPFNANYSITPRNRADLGAPIAGSTLLSIAEAKVDNINNADGNPPLDFSPDLLGQTVKVRGVVTSIDFRGGNGIEYYIQDPTGGVDIFNSTTNFGPYAIGDALEVVGKITQFNGLTEIDPGTTITNITLLAPGSLPSVSPQVVTLAQVADGGFGEAVEGRLIQINNISIISGTFPNSGSSGNVTISDGTNTAILRIDSDTNIDGTPTPTGTFSVIALASQFDSTAPLDSGYQLLPRSTADLLTGPVATLSATPTAITFPTVVVGGSNVASVTLTNNSTSSITLATPFTLTGTDANQFSVGSPVTTTLASGASTTVSVTFAPTSAITPNKMATLNVTSSNSGSATVSLTGVAMAAAGGGLNTPVVISEFRFVGPGAGNDEFIELYNNTNAPINIGGWKLKGSNNAGTTSVRATVGANIMIPARGHFLFVNSAAPTAQVALANQTYGTGITPDGGVAITMPDDTIVDQVGLSAGSAFKEGTTLTSLTTNVDRGYERKPGGATGSTLDTNNNSTDFQLLAPSNPQNLASLITPALVATPSSVNFGSISLGDIANVMVTITNNSTTTPVSLGTLSLSGTDANQFSFSAPTTSSLAPGSSLVVMVSFQPTTSSPSSKTALLSVPTTTLGANTVSINLTGTATPGISLSPTSLNFGGIQVGAMASMMVAITNNNSTAVSLTPPFTITGADANQFSVSSPPTLSLSPGDLTTIMVTFKPTNNTPLTKSATLTVTSVEGGNRTVSLSGMAIVCNSISLSPTTLPPGTRGVSYSQPLSASGGTSPYTFTLTSGQLPSGLQLVGNTISGTTNSAGSTTFAVTARDANGCTGAQSYTLTINKATTSTTVSVLPASPRFGQAITFMATVTGAGSIPTGIVTFFDGVTMLGTGTLNGSGVAAFSTSSLSVGAHALTANYGGDTNFIGSISSLVSFTISKADTTTSITSSQNPANFGQAVTFTATVAPVAPGAGTPSGTVQFKDGGVNLGSPVALTTGTTQFTTSTLTVGSHAITAVYSGDTNFNISTSTTLTQSINGLDHNSIYVADTANNRIQRSTNEGSTWQLVGLGPGTGLGQFNAPKGITTNFANTLIIVADTGNNRIQRSTDGGNSWQVIATPGTSPTQVNAPQGVAYDQTNDKLYVSDTGNNRILVATTISTTPAFSIFAGATAGSLVGKVNQPRGIAVDNAGAVYVADTTNNRIQVNATGLATDWAIFAAPGSAVGKVFTPSGIYVNDKNIVYVADTGNNRIQVNNKGTWSVYLSAGTVVGTVKAPQGVTSSLAGNLFVGDTGNNRVQRKNLSTGVTTVVGVSGTTVGKFNQPTGVR